VNNDNNQDADQVPQSHVRVSEKREGNSPAAKWFSIPKGFTKFTVLQPSFSDGVWFIDLAQVNDGTMALRTDLSPSKKCAVTSDER